jgi:acetyl/propionyl-CoA carboxylase alpha subunit
MKITLRTTDRGGGKEVELQRIAGSDSYSVRVDSRSYEIEFGRDDDAYWLRIHGRLIPFYAARSGDFLDIWLGGRTSRLELQRKGRGRASTAAAVPANEIAAPMPGTILKINVQPGDFFEAHKPLVIMESMKMELALSAPAAGRAAQVLCKPGELVQMGQVLIKLAGMESEDAS